MENTIDFNTIIINFHNLAPDFDIQVQHIKVVGNQFIYKFKCIHNKTTK